MYLQAAGEKRYYFNRLRSFRILIDWKVEYICSLTDLIGIYTLNFTFCISLIVICGVDLTTCALLGLALRTCRLRPYVAVREQYTAAQADAALHLQQFTRTNHPAVLQDRLKREQC